MITGVENISLHRETSSCRLWRLDFFLPAA